MSLLNLFRRNNDAVPIANRDEIIARYKHLRMVGRNLNNKLVKRLDKETLHEGGKRLGILQSGVLVFNSEDESSVLMDYCLYDVLRKGRNTIEQYLIDSPPDPESDEMTCLRAMQHAIYSLFVVESVERGLGVTVRDLRSNEIMLVVDMGFASSAQPGLVFASRLLFHDGFSMTGGAALPLAVLPEDKRDTLTKKLLAAVAAGDGSDFGPAPLIRACLRQGCSSNIQYQEPNGRLVGQQRVSAGNTPTKIGRNVPCPCGSGMKFKNCCLRKQNG